VCVSARLNAIKREAGPRARAVCQRARVTESIEFSTDSYLPRARVYGQSRSSHCPATLFIPLDSPRVSGRHKSPRTSGRESSDVASSTSARRGRENRLLSYGDTLIITHANELYESSPVYEHGSLRICAHRALRKASERIRRERGAKEAANSAKARDCLS